MDNPKNPESPLDHIVDDFTARAEAADFATGQMLQGATPEQVHSELLAQGWSDQDASELVERVRQNTRAARGVVTRDDVVRHSNQHYRASWGGWFAGFTLLASARRLAASLLYLRRRPPSGLR